MESIQIISPVQKVRLADDGMEILRNVAHECLQHAHRYAVMLTKEKLAKGGDLNPREIAWESLELYEYICTLQSVLDQVGLETEDVGVSVNDILRDIDEGK